MEDKLLQTNVQLTDEELDIIRRLARAENVRPLKATQETSC